jgi:tryptophan-rich sensory protein
MSFLDFPDDDPKQRNRRPLLVFLIATLAVGALGSMFTEHSIRGWYAGLVRPTFAPPDWVFAPVWTALYVLMAVAAWRVWRVVGLKGPALVAYWVQLVLNLGWCLVFFGLHQIGLALAEIAVLCLAVLATTILFWRADRLAGLMLLPYLAWTGFAALLNHGFWALNS